MEHLKVDSENKAETTNTLSEKEMNKIDPESGLTWRELVYGVSTGTLKDTAKGEDLKGKKKNLYERLFPDKKEKKHVSHEDAMEMIEFYHDTVSNMREFLAPYSQKYFSNLGKDIALAQMELIAIQTLMRSQDPASLEAVKNILKKEENFVEIGGVSHNLYELLFPKESENNEAIMNGILKSVAVSPDVAIKSNNPEFISSLEEYEESKMPADKSLGDDSRSSAEVVKKEKALDKAFKSARDYFDLQAKMYGMTNAEVRKFFPKIGEQVEANRLAIIAIESYISLHDKASLKAVQEILKNEKKYIKENKGTPLSGLFSQMKPQIEMILDV